jgi:hypothetical protein
MLVPLAVPLLLAAQERLGRASSGSSYRSLRSRSPSRSSTSIRGSPWTTCGRLPSRASCGRATRASTTLRPRCSSTGPGPRPSARIRRHADVLEGAPAGGDLALGVSVGRGCPSGLPASRRVLLRKSRRRNVSVRPRRPAPSLRLVRRVRAVPERRLEAVREAWEPRHPRSTRIRFRRPTCSPALAAAGG